MEKRNGFILFTESFPDEESCIRYFEEMRWNGKVVSPFDPSTNVAMESTSARTLVDTST